MKTTKLSINKNLELFLVQDSFLTLHNYTQHKTIIGDSNIPYHGFQAILDNYFDPDERDLCLDIFFLGNLYCAACKAKTPIDSLLSNKKSFIAGRLAIDATSVSFIDASKNCYILKPSIDLFKTLFNADGESKKYLLASLAWILLVKQGFSTYPGKDFFQYPLSKEGVSCKIDRTRVVGTYTLTSAILMTV